MNNEMWFGIYVYAEIGSDSNSDSHMHLAPIDDMREAYYLDLILNIPPRNVLLLLLVWVRDS